KGLGTEAVQLIVEYGFKILNLNNIMLQVFEFNKSAIRSYEKAGFNEFGRRREAYYLNGKYYDDIYMEILAKDCQTRFLNPIMPE
ncbi:MAG TPA: GNAT family protein, partial [Sporolactobacillaceae bacterium]|nr:GNAT family protein [Sporolactobacillaceae bacterium]